MIVAAEYSLPLPRVNLHGILVVSVFKTGARVYDPQPLDLPGNLLRLTEPRSENRTLPALLGVPCLLAKRSAERCSALQI